MNSKINYDKYNTNKDIYAQSASKFAGKGSDIVPPSKFEGGNPKSPQAQNNPSTDPKKPKEEIKDNKGGENAKEKGKGDETSLDAAEKKKVDKESKFQSLKKAGTVGAVVSIVGMLAFELISNGLLSKLLANKALGYKDFNDSMKEFAEKLGVSSDPSIVTRKDSEGNVTSLNQTGNSSNIQFVPMYNANTGSFDLNGKVYHGTAQIIEENGHSQVIMLDGRGRRGYYIDGDFKLAQDVKLEDREKLDARYNKTFINESFAKDNPELAQQLSELAKIGDTQNRITLPSINPSAPLIPDLKESNLATSIYVTGLSSYISREHAEYIDKVNEFSKLSTGDVRQGTNDIERNTSVRDAQKAQNVFSAIGQNGDLKDLVGTIANIPSAQYYQNIQKITDDLEKARVAEETPKAYAFGTKIPLKDTSNKPTDYTYTLSPDGRTYSIYDESQGGRKVSEIPYKEVINKKQAMGAATMKNNEPFLYVLFKNQDEALKEVFSKHQDELTQKGINDARKLQYLICNGDNITITASDACRKALTAVLGKAPENLKPEDKEPSDYVKEIESMRNSDDENTLSVWSKETREHTEDLLVRRAKQNIDRGPSNVRTSFDPNI